MFRFEVMSRKAGSFKDYRKNRGKKMCGQKKIQQQVF